MQGSASRAWPTGPMRHAAVCLCAGEPAASNDTPHSGPPKRRKEKHKAASSADAAHAQTPRQGADDGLHNSKPVNGALSQVARADAEVAEEGLLPNGVPAGHAPEHVTSPEQAHQRKIKHKQKHKHKRTVDAQ